MKLLDNKIYLASKSPRRRELLRQIGVNFEILLLRDSATRPVDVSETVLPDELPAAYVTRVTNAKAEAAWDMMELRKLPIRPVLAADTTVVLNGVIYGKPANRSEAHAMLTSLSGQTHQVLTSIAVHYKKQHLEFTQTSAVTFCTLNKNQLDQYCDSLEPYDKAGGYGIQGSAAKFISHIDGSYSGIMGLPLFETAKLLTEVGLTFS
ncbi:Maf family protein [Solimicrobium silvestre]|nr:Maf family protein [Solimicrobium silvestre]